MKQAEWGYAKGFGAIRQRRPVQGYIAIDTLLPYAKGPMVIETHYVDNTDRFLWHITDLEGPEAAAYIMAIRPATPEEEEKIAALKSREA